MRFEGVLLTQKRNRRKFVLPILAGLGVALSVAIAILMLLNPPARGPVVFVVFVLFGTVLTLFFQLAVERRIGNLAITTNILTFVQAMALFGSLLSLKANDTRLVGAAVVVLVLNFIINIVLALIYQQMRIRWK